MVGHLQNRLLPLSQIVNLELDADYLLKNYKKKNNTQG